MTVYISGASLRRLPQYMKLLARLADEEQRYVTSAEIAQMLKLDETLVRKDLSLTQFAGKPRVGFEVTALHDHLESFLGLRQPKEAFIIGAGRLGQALAHYHGFERQNLRIAGVFDNDPQKIGRHVGEMEILPLWKAPALARQLNVRIAILTVPPRAAQAVAELLADAGMLAFWNFSGHPLHLPEPYIVQNEDLTDSLAVISHRLAQHPQPGQAGESRLDAVLNGER